MLQATPYACPEFLMKLLLLLTLLVGAMHPAKVLASQPASSFLQVPGEASRTAKAAATPIRWKHARFPENRLVRLAYGEMSAARILQVQQYNATRVMKPTQIGIGRVASREGSRSNLSSLQWLTLADGSSVARAEFSSPVALALRVGLVASRIDPRAELRFAGSDDSQRIVAAITGLEIRRLTDAGGLFWTPSTDGETQFVELYLPPGVSRRTTSLQSPELSHLLSSSVTDFKIIPKVGESDGCNVDAVCKVAELGPHYVNAKNAVAHMQFQQTRTNGTVGTFVCTGTLLTDTVAATQLPYFYTAHHCFAGGMGGVPATTDFQSVANTLNTYWKYETTSCGSGIEGNTELLVGGADFLYSNADTDAMLLRLARAAPAGSYFSGWNTGALAASSDVVAIHHPGGDAKKVSLGRRLQNNAFRNEVGWLLGTTESGSSGSAIFTADANGYALRGGLWGGSASCSDHPDANGNGLSDDPVGNLGHDGNRDYYSRFDVAFPGISQYLAPASSLPIRVNGSQPLIPPRAAPISPSASAAMTAPAAQADTVARDRALRIKPLSRLRDVRIFEP